MDFRQSTKVLQLLVGWRADIQNSGDLRPRHFKRIARWFLDEEVGRSLATDPRDPWQDLVLKVDDSISRAIGPQGS